MLSCLEREREKRNEKWEKRKWCVMMGPLHAYNFGTAIMWSFVAFLLCTFLPLLDAPPVLLAAAVWSCPCTYSPTNNYPLSSSPNQSLNPIHSFVMVVVVGDHFFGVFFMVYMHFILFTLFFFGRSHIDLGGGGVGVVAGARGWSFALFLSPFFFSPSTSSRVCSWSNINIIVLI